MEEIISAHFESLSRFRVFYSIFGKINLINLYTKKSKLSRHKNIIRISLFERLCFKKSIENDVIIHETLYLNDKVCGISLDEDLEDDQRSYYVYSNGDDAIRLAIFYFTDGSLRNAELVLDGKVFFVSIISDYGKYYGKYYGISIHHVQEGLQVWETPNDIIYSSERDNVKNGFQTKYSYQNQKLSEEFFRNDLEDGLSITWNGSKKVSEGLYKNGQKNGPWYTWSPNFRKVENYINGLREGVQKTFYSDGTSQTEIYRNGEKIIS